MWLSRWSPDFTPEEDSPLAPVWVLLPKLPFHLHTWHYIKQILSPVGTPMYMDVATNGKTRPSMAKVRVEIDLSKPRLSHVFVGSKNATNPLHGHEQKVEYEGITKYCNHCRLQGHEISQCRRLEKELADPEEQNDNEQANDRNKGVQENDRNTQHNQKGKEVQTNVESNKNASTSSKIADATVTKEKQSSQRANSQDNRGRDTMIDSRNAVKNRRGRSEPPKQIYRPTGAIFGIDKPSPSVEGINKSSESYKAREKTNARPESPSTQQMLVVDNQQNFQQLTIDVNLPDMRIDRTQKKFYFDQES
uniref:Uncharacterized protein LOC104217118 n=1 Tax=Nicotiana sylvestris TaxID=4096 RepID=A0A1U7VUI5_NICSY|nr:PREDICTED: uncharacterized protein LOC104217118 [Nicotiana sylvestris]